MRSTRRQRGVAPAGALLLAALLGGCAGQPGPAPEGVAATTPASPAAEDTTTAAPSPTTPPSPSTTAAPTTSTPTTSAPTPTTTTKPAPSPKPSPKPTPTVKPTPKEGDTLHPGDSGAYVLSVQKRLASLGYWLGGPDGTYGYLTTQSVMALQKAAGLGRDGVFGPATRRALEAGVRPQSRTGGTGVEIDLQRQLLLVVRGGSVTTILNTSTGNGEMFESYGRRCGP